MKKIPAIYGGVIDYRIQNYVFEMRRSLRRLVFKRRAASVAVRAPRFVL